MTSPKGFTDCEQLAAYHALYAVPVAALLWCDVPPNQIQAYLDKASQTNVRGVLSLSNIPCFEIRCRALHIAIENGELLVCREKGVPVDQHVAPERRHVRRADLKAWIAREYPNDKPAFLFDEIERKTHSAIDTEAFLALQVDRDAAKVEIKKITQQLEEITSERDVLKSCIDKMSAAQTAQNIPGERSEITYLNIIGGLLNLMLSNSPSGNPQSVFQNQAAIISALLAYHENKPGISSRTLEEKFAAAKRSLAAN
jgi:FtsZ-binding cell division protein ZapB